MEKRTGLQERIRDQYDSMSKGRKRLADFVLQNYDQAAFMTAARLGKAAGVSESTVVRFAMEVGCSGYPEFQRELENLIKRRIHPLERMDEVYGELEQPEILERVLQSDMECIAATRQSVDGRAFAQALEILEQARRVYIVGLRVCAPLAAYLHLNLKLAREDVFLLSSSNEHELLEQMITLDRQDAVVGISFPRYSLRTLKMLEFASSRQASVITLTDSIHSPLNLYSSCNLTASSDMSSVAPSLTAPMSVINALITALCIKNRDRVLEHLRQVEQTLGDYQIFGSDELDRLEDYVELRPFPLRENF